MLRKPDLAEFKKLLLSRRARLRGDVEHLTDAALDRGEGNADSRSPTHLAELGTETYEQDFSLRVVENDQDILDEIDAALDRIKQGTYGLCELCVQEGKTNSKSSIPKARLRAIPWVRNCVSCEEKREQLSL